ncbi:MAG: hypothetical protein MZV70_45455 [Desulfobacterales bacterium]|nr:hypothetical protein [Desulfobacterales bacterium]
MDQLVIHDEAKTSFSMSCGNLELVTPRRRGTGCRHHRRVRHDGGDGEMRRSSRGLDGPSGIAVSGIDGIRREQCRQQDWRRNDRRVRPLGSDDQPIADLGTDGPPGSRWIESGSVLFVPSYEAGTVGAYTTSGTTVNASLISGLRQPHQHRRIRIDSVRGGVPGGGRSARAPPRGQRRSIPALISFGSVLKSA